MKRTAVGFLTCVGVGLYAMAALGSLNHAAHLGDWGLRAMYAFCGLSAAVAASRLASRRRPVTAEADWRMSALVIIGSFLPLAVWQKGTALLPAGAWLAAAGGALAVVSGLALGDCFAIAPAARGTVSRGPYALVRHPLASSFVAMSLGILLVRFSPWNALVLGVACLTVVAAAFAEERVLRADPAYGDYARRVPRRFIPGLI